MFKDILPEDYAGQLIKQLPKGALMVVKDNEKENVMTIGWGTIGFVWRKPVLMVMVRYSRLSYEMLEKTKEFTVNIPIANSLQKEIGICGSKSGRDVDKFKECGFTKEKGKVLDLSVIKECDLFYECKVIYQQAMEPGVIDQQIKESFYTNKNNDYHVLYYGEIIASYIKES